MSDRYHEHGAAPLPSKAKLIEELHSGIQMPELKDGGPTAPSYEEAISCSYPALPVQSASMQGAQPPMHQQSPPYHAPPPMVGQPHNGNLFPLLIFNK